MILPPDALAQANESVLHPTEREIPAMKISRTNIVVGVISFLLGAVVTVIAAWIPLSRFFATSSANVGAADIVYSLTTLNALKSGKITNAMELLEVQLDGGIIVLGSKLEELPAHLHHKNQIKQMKAAWDYRAKYPRKSDDPDMDATVAAYLDAFAAKE
ncbi:MAG: hypothetical protein HC841_04205 [Verrucomicrobiae bacterium]|nr:hypothetical protein [Verrucomicrobiae bacterium]